MKQQFVVAWRALGVPETAVEARTYSPHPALRELVAANSLSLAFLDVATDAEAALSLAMELRDLGMPVVALHTGNAPDLILRCMRHGAAEFLYPPFTPELVGAALARLAKRSQAALAPARSGGEVYCLMRGKSGCGSTTLACNLAFQVLALDFQKVLLGDLDPLTGTIAFLLKLSSNYSFVHALANASRMDEPLWRGLVTSLKGVDVLLSPETPGDLVYEDEDLVAMVRYWRQIYQFVILNIPGPNDALGLSLARRCDELLLVTTNELPAVHATQNSLACLEHHGVDKSKIKLVVNRYNTDIGLSCDAIEAALDLKVFQHLPSDFEAVQKALMEGKPLPPSTKVGKSIVELAERLTGRKRVRRQSLFGGLFSAFQSL